MKTADLKALLDDMTMEEKILQLVQLPGATFEEDAAVTGLSDSQIPENVRRLAGSTLGIFGADKVRKIQKEYVEKHPHHIPLLFMLDVIHGHKTVMPCPLGQGATFDPEVVKKGAQVQAKEAAADGVHVTFSPMGDLVRDARWGRVVESTGEDKFLNGKMIAAMVEGYQGDDLKNTDHVAACVKHFAAYGGVEAGRDYNNVELSEHTLREFYLPAYSEGISAGAKLVMTSFNTLNGIPSSGNKWLMRDILRKEMGFDGVLISDWAAIAEMEKWGFAEDLKEAAKLAMEAGVDIDMCTESYYANLEELIKSGEIDESLLDEAVLRVLTLKNDLGLFEDPYRDASEEKSRKVSLSAESREIARDAVRKSLVLLKNCREALPLKVKKIAFIGPYIDEKELRSAWAISSDPKTTVTIEEAATKHYEKTDCQVKFAKGCEILDNNTELGFFTFTKDNLEAENGKLLAKALEVADWADEVVLCLGEHYSQTGESTSRVELSLPKPQLKLFDEVSKRSKKLTTLIVCGRPLVLEDIIDRTDALMISFRPGTEGGNGIIDVLSGAVSPSGKLPMSFPYCVGQEPIHYDRYSTGRPKPTEGTTIFTSRYLDCSNEPRYCFGYGLTYSKFDISEVRFDKDTLTRDSEIIATATVRNIGKVEATEVVQLYIRDMAGSRVRPIKELKGFERVTLKPGESQDVSFKITEDMLRFFTINNVFESEKGKFTAYIGFSSDTDNGKVFSY